MPPASRILIGRLRPPSWPNGGERPGPSGEQEMEWKDLSTQAKSILEYVVAPHAGTQNTIEIEVGRPARFSKNGPGNSSPIEPALFAEIRAYVESNRDDYSVLEVEGERIRLRCTDEVASGLGVRRPGFF